MTDPTDQYRCSCNMVFNTAEEIRNHLLSNKTQKRIEKVQLNSDWETTLDELRDILSVDEIEALDLFHMTKSPIILDSSDIKGLKERCVKHSLPNEAFFELVYFSNMVVKSGATEWMNDFCDSLSDDNNDNES